MEYSSDFIFMCLAASIVSFIILYQIIKYAGKSANAEIKEYLKVQNNLLRKQLNIEANNLEELEEHYKNGFYNYDYYTDRKENFKFKKSNAI